MQVRHGAQVLSHDKEVHHLAVIGNERRPAALVHGRGVDPERDQPRARAVAHSYQPLDRRVDAAGVGFVLLVPPEAAEHQQRGDDHGRDAAHEPTALATGRVGFEPGLERGLTRRRTDNRDQPRDQEESERGQADAHFRVHGEHRRRCGHVRHDRGALACRTLDVHSYRVAARLHDPELITPECAVAHHARELIGRRRALLAAIPDVRRRRHGRDAAAADAHDDLGARGNDGRCANDHAHRIRPRRALEEGVGAADVSGREERARRDACRERGPLPASHPTNASRAPSTHPTRGRGGSRGWRATRR